ERLSKEGYNILAELDAALEARAFRDACQVISMSAGIGSVGLLPDDRDPRLWRPFPAAMEATMRDNPALRETMQQEFGPTGKLRVKQAIAAGDATAVETAALQFCGTDAARDAAAWLGDRCLSSGRFAEALEHYRSGLRDASDERQGSLLARLRLAGALTGRDVGSPVAYPVEIGSGHLSAAQFEQLIDELRLAHQIPHNSAPAAGAATSPAEAHFLPGRYSAHPWARVDGRRVERPSAMPDRGFDWSGRQTAVLVTDRWMLVNNQLDQLAFDLESGTLVWAQCRAVESRYQQWPLVRMRPVVALGRVFVRQLVDEGPELVALETATGRILWSSRPDGHVASDPLFLGGRLFALTVNYHPGEKLALSLTRFDPDSGRVVRQNLLAEFRDVWRRRLPVQATVVDGRIVATVGGSVLSCDASGRVSWLRRQIWVPPPGDSHYQAREWCEQAHEPPLVRDGRVYATQPGVWAVESLQSDTGRLLWRRPVGGLTRPVGLASGRLIVQTSDGLTAIDAESGEVLWDHALDDRAEAHLCGQTDLILAHHFQENGESPERPQLALVWIDAETGRAREQTVLELPETSAPWLGPLVAHGGRQWALVASADDPKSRQVIELKLDRQP
ncbi:MAG: PQQ-like beta-propeller repeat protein, partial [Planctomycetes bacterium]|nr:PQQ-like beta-propeller repeat protein [Planctomycetota bacterium]